MERGKPPWKEPRQPQGEEDSVGPSVALVLVQGSPVRTFKRQDTFLLAYFLDVILLKKIHSFPLYPIATFVILLCCVGLKVVEGKKSPNKPIHIFSIVSSFVSFSLVSLYAVLVMNRPGLLIYAFV